MKSYRLIFLLSSCYKLLKRLILNRISNRINKHVSIEQAGFRPHHSCQYKVTDWWRENSGGEGWEGTSPVKSPVTSSSMLGWPSSHDQPQSHDWPGCEPVMWLLSPIWAGAILCLVVCPGQAAILILVTCLGSSKALSHEERRGLCYEQTESKWLLFTYLNRNHFRHGLSALPTPAIGRAEKLAGALPAVPVPSLQPCQINNFHWVS